MVKKRAYTLPSVMGWLLSIGGAVGLAASSILVIEKIASLKDPGFEPSCDISPFISCGAVMDTPVAEVFANPLIGVAGFAVVTTIGVAILAGAQFKRWFWLGLQAGAAGGVLFVHWLFFYSVYVVGALCPYCMVVWAVVIPLFWYVTLYNLRQGNIAAPLKWQGFVGFLQRHHGNILLAWFLIIIIMIVYNFWHYWSTLI